MMVSRKTKVNGSRVRLPYKHREDVLVIDSVGHGVQLNTTMGWCTVISPARSLREESLAGENYSG